MLDQLQIDLESPVPVYRQIADAVRRGLEQGELPPGTRLPPTRDLARRLGINRNTVVSAYDALAQEGLVQSHTGRGTFLVTPGGDYEAPGPSGGDAAPWFSGFSRAVERAGVGRLLSMYRVVTSKEGISFAGSYPASDLMPVEPLRKAISGSMKEAGEELLGYGPTAGHEPLRRWIAGSMRKQGSVLDADQVLITNGAQQALELVFRVMIDSGDPVVIEEPTYTGALSALHSLGARVVGVPVDAEGMRPDLLAVALERHRPRLIYLQPTFQNPTTSVMSEARRREILAVAERHRCVVVEDDWGGELCFDGKPLPPSLHALDGGRRVIYLSTFSKKLLPGLRIGFVVAPPEVMEPLISLKQIRDCGTSPLLQAGLHRFLQSGGLNDHLRHALPVYRERRDATMAAMERYFPQGVRWTRPAGGLFTWVTVPPAINTTDLFESARREGVLFSRGELFHSGGGGSDTLRLTFAGNPPHEIESGIKTLGSLMTAIMGKDERDGEAAARAVPIL